MSYLLLDTSFSAGPATTIAVNAGNGQSATVGTAVAIAPSVIVTDADGAPVSGTSVTFAVASGGGSATGLTQTTDANGIATVGSWTLGTAAGVNTLTATSGSLTGSPVTFSAAATADVAATISIAAGDADTAPVGHSVVIPPTALIVDQYGNPVAGTTVTFAVVSGGGSATDLTPTTTASGLAMVGSWTLGPIPGVNTMSATAAGLSGSPLTFTATGTLSGSPQVARFRFSRMR